MPSIDQLSLTQCWPARGCPQTSAKNCDNHQLTMIIANYNIKLKANSVTLLLQNFGYQGGSPLHRPVQLKA